MEDQETRGDNDSHQTGTCGGEAFLEWKVFQFGCCFHGMLFRDDTLVEHYGQLGIFQSLLRRGLPEFSPNKFLRAVVLNLISVKLYLLNGRVAHTDDKSQHAIFYFYFYCKGQAIVAPNLPSCLWLHQLICRIQAKLFYSCKSLTSQTTVNTFSQFCAVVLCW